MDNERSPRTVSSRGASLARPALRFAMLAALAAGCSSASADIAQVPGADAASDASASEAAAPVDKDANLPPVDMTGPIGGDRPASVRTPPGYDASKKYPLLVFLHAFTVAGSVEALYLGLPEETDRQGYVLAIPEGKTNADGNPYWNATDACCDLFASGVDDFTYVRDVIRQVQARYAIDPKRIYLFGHSNGAFLAHRLACEQSHRIAGIAGLAGAMWQDAAKCAPDTPVAALTIHGTKDETIAYEGGVINHKSPVKAVPYPSARETIATWGSRNGCGPEGREEAERLDLDTSLAGSETRVTRYAACKPGGAAELWTLDEGKHLPAFTPAFLPGVFAFWSQHARP